MTSFSGVPFVLFCFVFVFMLSLKPRPFVQSFFDICRRPDSHTCSSFVLLSFCLFGDVAFPEYFLYHFRFLFVMESTSYVLSFRMVFFYLVTTGWILTSAYVRIRSVKQSTCRNSSTDTEKKNISCYILETLQVIPIFKKDDSCYVLETV